MFATNLVTEPNGKTYEHFFYTLSKSEYDDVLCYRINDTVAANLFKYSVENGLCGTYFMQESTLNKTCVIRFMAKFDKNGNIKLNNLTDEMIQLLKDNNITNKKDFRKIAMFFNGKKVHVL